MICFFCSLFTKRLISFLIKTTTLNAEFSTSYTSIVAPTFSIFSVSFITLFSFLRVLCGLLFYVCTARAAKQLRYQNKDCNSNSLPQFWQTLFASLIARRYYFLVHISIYIRESSEAIPQMLCHPPFDAPDFVGIAQGEQILCSS